MKWSIITVHIPSSPDMRVNRIHVSNTQHQLTASVDLTALAVGGVLSATT